MALPPSRTHRRELFALLFATTMALMPLSGASAASPNPDPHQFGTNQPKGSGVPPLSPQGATCYTVAFIQKVHGNQAAASGFETCSGNVLVMRITQWIDRCEFEFPAGNCVTWQAWYAFPTCSKSGAGTLWCPASGAWTVTPQAGRYKTRQHTEVQDTTGGYADDWYETNSIVFP